MQYFTVTNSAGQFICGKSQAYPYPAVSCQNVQLQRGQTYTVTTQGCFITCPPNTLIRYSGRPLKLVLSATQIGLLEVPIPGSSNCIVQDITNSNLSTGVLNQIDSGAPRSISLSQEGDAQSYARGYREKAGVISYFYGTDQVPAVCDQYNKKVTGFSKHTGMAGQCWAIQDPAVTLFDGSTQQFCCSDSACQQLYGLGSDHKCVDNVCKQATQGNVQCLVASDCSFSPQYIETWDGKVILREAACVNSQCTTKDTQIACNPTRSYPNNQCCKLDVATNTYRLEQCTVPLRACDTLGADACCLATQSTYTVRPAPEGKYCCDKDGDSLGRVVDSKEVCDSGGGGGRGACKQEGQSVSPVLGETCCQGLTPDGGLFGFSATCKKQGIQLPLELIFSALFGLAGYAALRKKDKIMAIAAALLLFLISYSILTFIIHNWLLVLIGGALFLWFFGGAILLVLVALVSAWRKG